MPGVHAIARVASIAPRRARLPMRAAPAPAPAPVAALAFRGRSALEVRDCPLSLHTPPPRRDAVAPLTRKNRRVEPIARSRSSRD